MNNAIQILHLPYSNRSTHEPPNIQLRLRAPPLHYFYRSCYRNVYNYRIQIWRPYKLPLENTNIAMAFSSALCTVIGSCYITRITLLSVFKTMNITPSNKQLRHTNHHIITSYTTTEILPLRNTIASVTLLQPNMLSTLALERI